MPNFAIVENGVIVNVADASDEFASQQGWIALPDGFGITDLYDGVNFSKAPEIEVPELVVPVVPPLTS